MSNFDETYTPDSRLQTPDLSSFDDDFASAEAPEYDEVPDGKYQVRIEIASSLSGKFSQDQTPF